MNCLEDDDISDSECGKVSLFSDVLMWQRVVEEAVHENRQVQALYLLSTHFLLLRFGLRTNFLCPVFKRNESYVKCMKRIR